MYGPAELARGVYAVLSGDATLNSLILNDVVNGHGAVQMAAETDGDFSYVEIGQWGSQADDDYSTDGWNVAVDVHVWVRLKDNQGFGPIYPIASRIYELLHRQEVAVTAGMDENTCWMIQRTSERCVADPDGLTMHGTITFETHVKDA